MSRRVGWAIALACTALVVAAVPASAQWRPVQRQCFAGSALVTGCTTIPGFGGAWNVAVSPDGRTAYTTSLKTGGSAGRGSIHVFNRNPATGTLALKPGADGCITHTDTAPVTGCAQARAIGRADEIMISADGRFVYIASQDDVTATPNMLAGAVAVFSRNTTTGVLTQLPGQQGCINDDGSEGCFDGQAIGGRGAVLSGGQQNIYVLGQESLAVLQRNTANGTLSQALPGCFGLSGSGDNCVDTTPRPGGRQLALSGDGRQLYTPAAKGLRLFNRNPSTGALTVGGCVTQDGSGNGCGRVPGIGLVPRNLVISPDSKNVYLSHVDGIVTFGRNANGTLAFRSCINDAGNAGCANSSNVSNLGFMAASPDGQDVVAVPQGSPGGFTAFARNASTGALTRRGGRDGCLTPDGSGFNNGTSVADACRSASGMSLFGHIRFSGNGLIYAGFFGGDRIAVVKRDFYPVCTGRSVTVRRNRAKTIPLTCSDRNGDAITRAILQPPGAGTLGAIQASGNVIYSPFSGFTGNDTFSFRATAGGLTSATAAIDLTVRKRAPKGIRGVSLSYAYLAFSDHTVLTKLKLKKVPRGSRVRAVCALKGRRCDGKARAPFSKKRARGTVNLAKRFVGVDLKVGSRITVTVTKRGLVGAAKVVTIRARKAPKIVSRCLRPGSKKLRKRC
jgi:DNA-binding beta-propeller fold protein YncE